MKFRNMNASINFIDGKEVVTSYNSNILRLDHDTRIIEVGEDFDYSKTTGKQVRHYFRDELNMDIGVADIRKALKTGEKLYEWTFVKNDNL